MRRYYTLFTTVNPNLTTVCLKFKYIHEKTTVINDTNTEIRYGRFRTGRKYV